jgi:hypothetical protein
MTAGELLNKLNSDPAYTRMRTDKEAAAERLRAELANAEAPLIEELNSIGVHVKSVWDLVNTSSSYRTAIPVLLRHLTKPYPEAIIEGIARALGTNEAREQGWQLIVNEYRKTDPATKPRAKDGLAVALAGASDDSVIGDLINLAKDRHNGESRVLLLFGLRRSDTLPAKKAIIDLAGDPQLAGEISSWRVRSWYTMPNGPCVAQWAAPRKGFGALHPIYRWHTTPERAL